MKILLIARLYIDLDEHIGVRNKVQSQIHAMKQLGHSVDFVTLDLGKESILLNDEPVKSIPSNRWLKQLFFYRKAYLEITKLAQNYDLIYIRYQWCDPSFIHLLKKIKSRNIPIFLEFPGYPIKSNVNSKMSYIRYLLDKKYGKQIKKYVTLTGNFSHHNETYGIPSLSMANGIDKEIITQMPRTIESGKDLRLIGIANISKWHAYDRIIKGIKNYNELSKKRKITFQIIGEGQAKASLIALTNQLQLHDSIQFYPAKYSDELQSYYETADIGVGSLGFFRANQKYGSTLKLREYSAKGIPFIYAYEDPDFENCSFALKFENDDSPIDIEAVFEFYDSLNHETPTQMRSYALEHLTWEGIMKKLLTKLQLS